MTRSEAIAALRDSLLTVKEYAHITRRHPEYIRTLCRRGKQPGARRVGGRWLIAINANIAISRIPMD